MKYLPLLLFSLSTTFFFSQTVQIEVDIVSGTGSSGPKRLFVYNETLYFAANDGITGSELWKFDGTNYSLVSDINPISHSHPRNFIEYNGDLIFSANGGASIGQELYKYNGSSISYVDVLPGGGSSSPHSLCIYNNELFFTATDSSGDAELWKYDGVNTVLVENINSSGSSNPTELIVYDSLMYFAATTPLYGKELMLYNGDSVSIVKDINVGPSSSGVGNLAIYNDKLFFAGGNNSTGAELWQYDGDTAVMIQDIKPGANGSNPTNIMVYRNELYFAANDGVHGTELWKYNDTTAQLVNDIYTGVQSSFPEGLIAYNDKLFFMADDGVHGFELWAYHNDSAYLIEDIRGGSAGQSRYVFESARAVYNSKLFFSAFNSSYGSELWSVSVNYDSLITVVTCDSFTSPSGDSTWYTSGTYYDTVSDTAFTINLTTNLLSTSTTAQTVCDSLVSPSGKYTWKSTGNYMDTILNALGCDSVMMFNLTVKFGFNSTDSISICQGDSILINSTWIYNDTLILDTLTASTGCDSVVTYTITSNTVTPTVDLGADLLICINDTAVLSAGTYNKYLWSNGDTTSSTMIDANTLGIGTYVYWAEVTDVTIGCSDIDSIIVDIVQCVGLKEALETSMISLYPNPVKGDIFTINFTGFDDECVIEVRDATARLISRTNRNNENQLKLKLGPKKGLYFVTIKTETEQFITKLIK